MAQQKITIDSLARMMNNSFMHLENKMDKRFEDMDKRFDDLEIMVGRHENRITRLEDDVRVVKNTIGKK